MKKFIALIATTLLFCLTTQVWAAPAAPLLSYETDGLNLTVSWTEVPGAAGYTLYYAEYPYSPGDPADSLDRGGATSFSIDLWVGAAYYLAVTAYDASNEESIFSNIEQFTIVEPTPEVPVLTYETDGLGITVSWTEVPDAAGYNFYFAPYPITGPDAFSHIDVDNQTSLSFYLWEDAAYYLSVKAYNGSGVEGESSNTELFIMGPPTPEWVDDDEDMFSEYDGDCDDTNASINPDAEEICGDGIDQDCSGSDLSCPTGESSFESELRTLINQYRSTNSLGSLSLNLTLQRVALEHSDYMLQTGDFSHAGFAEIRAPKVFAAGCNSVVENLAWNFQTAQAAFNGWRNSSGHNTNMLNPDINYIGLSKSGAYITMLGCRIP